MDYQDLIQRAKALIRKHHMPPRQVSLVSLLWPTLFSKTTFRLCILGLAIWAGAAYYVLEPGRETILGQAVIVFMLIFGLFCFVMPLVALIRIYTTFRWGSLGVARVESIEPYGSANTGTWSVDLGNVNYRVGFIFDYPGFSPLRTGVTLRVLALQRFPGMVIPLEIIQQK